MGGLLDISVVTKLMTPSWAAVAQQPDSPVKNFVSDMAQKQIFEERSRFLKGLPLSKFSPVRPEIISSWQRSRRAGADPDQHGVHILEPSAFAAVREANSDFLEIAIPTVNQFLNDIQGSQTNVILTDAKGIVLYSIGYGTGFGERPACSIAGFDISEQVDGTTAMGLCLAEKKAVYVTGAEHYKSIFDNWHCTAAPIFDASNRLLGTVGLVIDLQSLHMHTLGMASAASLAISEQIKLRMLLQMHKGILGLLNEAVIVLDSSYCIKEMNQYACKLFNCSSHVVGRNVSSIIRNRSSITQLYEITPVSDREHSFSLTGGGQMHCTLSATRTMDGGLLINLREQRRMQHYAKRLMGATAKYTFDDILGNSLPMQKSRQLAEAACSNAAPVLVLGESGVGKELFAQAIHNGSSRSQGPFIALNCGAIPRELVQSELFGYEAGAFTGASRDGMPGKFEMADGGTLFLDEIGDMALNVQVNLLRVLQEGVVTRVGGKTARAVDVRVIAATHRNLAVAVDSGAFRRDLFYRLNVLSIRIPPLRERDDDVGLLARFFLEKYQASIKKNIEGFGPGVMDLLESYHWPGNVRELENIIERAAIITRSSLIQREDMPMELLAKVPPSPLRVLTVSGGGGQKVSPISFETKNLHTAGLGTTLQEQEEHLIINTLEETRGNMRAAAKILGISRGTLYSRLRRYGIEPGPLRQ